MHRSLINPVHTSLYLLRWVLICLAITGQVRAAGGNQTGELAVMNWRQDDIDDDGNPEFAIWETVWNGDSYSVAVFDRGSDMSWTADWRKGTDFVNDTWLFDYEADGTYELVIHFSRADNRQLVADVWDDQNNDGEVGVTLADGIIIIEESPFPTMSIRAQADWPNASGRLAGNISFLYDGLPKKQYRFNALSPTLTHDGVFDFETRVVDQDEDGVADFVHTHVLQEIPVEYAVPREHLYANVRKQYPELSAEPLYWQLLNYDDAYASGNYFSSPPHINVDWNVAKIASYGITGYPIEQGYHVNNLNHWEESKVNHANFENAMSYYDLADNHDRLPELHVRHVYWPHQESFYAKNALFDTNEIVYSWRLKEATDLLWDYKISVMGSQPVTTSVQYDTFGLFALPYWDLPNWVIRRSWPVATFVAAEDRNYVSSEGIYEWSTSEGVIYDIRAPWDEENETLQRSLHAQRQCMRGGGNCKLGTHYDDIAVGLRGEYRGVPNDKQPWLYVSPIDNRLHLKWAEHSVWRLDADHIIRAMNLDGDEVLDVWSREARPESELDDQVQVPGDTDTVAQVEVIETLYALGGHLLHTNGSHVTLVAGNFESMLFESLPPTDHVTWEALRTQLAPYEEQRRDPNDLYVWLDAFIGPRSEIARASVENVRMTSGGFRFELILEPGFQVTGPDLLDLDRLGPGEYVVEKNKGVFAVTPLIPPQISLDIRPLPVSEGAGLLQIAIHNAATGDASGVTVIAETEDEDGSAVEFHRQIIDAPAGETRRVLVDYPFAATGGILQVRLEDADGQVVAATTSTLSASASPMTNDQVIFSIWHAPALPLVLLLFGMSVAGVTILAISCREQPAA